MNVIIKEIEGVIEMEPGAPCPVLVATDSSTSVSFYKLAEDVMVDLSEIEIYTVIFDSCIYHQFGAPNDETLSGHPYYALGLGAYGFYEVENSDLIKHLERINSVHPYHNKSRWKEYSHYIITFHDNMFECVATGYNISVSTGTPARIAKDFLQEEY